MWLKTHKYIFYTRHARCVVAVFKSLMILLPCLVYASTILHQISHPLLEILKRWTSLSLCPTTTGSLHKYGAGVWTIPKPSMGTRKIKICALKSYTSDPRALRSLLANARTVNYVCGSLLKKLLSCWFTVRVWPLRSSGHTMAGQRGCRSFKMFDVQCLSYIAGMSRRV
jgi:hypothetical protein